MERTAQKHGFLNLIALLVVGLGTLAVSRYCQSLAGLVTTVFLGIGVSRSSGRVW